MKISIITLSFPYPLAGSLPGIENSTLNLSLSLKKLGHEVNIITTFWNGGKRLDNFKGISILRIKESKAILGSLGSIFTLNHYTFGLKLLFKRNFKFFFDSDFIIMPLALGFNKFFKIKNIPVLSIYHHKEIPNSILDYLTIPFYKHLAKKQFKNHKYVIVRSNYIKNDLIKNYKIKENNVIVISDGVDLNNFNPKKVDLNVKKMYGKNILLSVGPFYYRKRIPILLKAITYLMTKFDDFHVQLIGKGPYLSFCMELSEKLGLNKKVTFLGYVDRNSLSRYFASSDLFIFPSETEGFGQVLIEALASGTPVICVNKPPMSNIIEDGGITFKLNNSKDLSNKILKLLEDHKKLETLRNKTFLIAKKYSWINIANKYIEIIKLITH